jgi:hypothetical protein
MSWDCKYKLEENQCHRLKKVCSPGEKGCILYKQFSFPIIEKKQETPKSQNES